MTAPAQAREPRVLWMPYAHGWRGFRVGAFEGYSWVIIRTNGWFPDGRFHVYNEDRGVAEIHDTLEDAKAAAELVEASA